MTHQHSVSANIGLNRAFKTGIFINLLFIILEIVFGLISNSMGLVADAGHNFGDVLTLIFSWLAVWLAKRTPTLKFTYGFRRSTILIALLNTILMLVTTAFILWETISRIGHPVEVNSLNVIIIASIGIFINGITAWLFMKGRKHDLNVRSAFVHFAADALVSLGVVISGLLILMTGYNWFDTLISFVVVLVILYSTWHLLIDSINLALDGVPSNTDINAVRDFLVNLPEVSDVHDLHIWALSTTETALTVHLVTRYATGTDFIMTIREKLRDHFDISHSTIQVEPGPMAADENNCN